MEPEYSISTDPARLDRELIHRFLSEDSYWAKGVTREVVDRSIENSMPFGVYLGDEQVAFARVITDRATFAWVADVFVVSGHRGNGLGKRLMEEVLAHPDLQVMRRWLLGTADAHDLYRRFGFREIQAPGRFMAREADETARACCGGFDNGTTEAA
jgi:GNAT superfamily N-acetyltransferase